MFLCAIRQRNHRNSARIPPQTLRAGNQPRFCQIQIPRKQFWQNRVRRIGTKNSVTEFVSERTITFHITIYSARPTFGLLKNL